MGHVETRVFKDIIPRYKTMRGYRVERKAGWDTQGLPVELEVEKAIGVSGKKDIEAYGIAKFNEACRQSVWKYKQQWEAMTERVGFWLDLDHPYITYTNEYIETLWWIFKQAWEAGLLTQDYKVLPYCPRCGTALSSHEVAQGYQRVTDRSVYVKFRVRAQNREWENTSILSWTTTPWTLPGNVALAINSKEEYVCVPDPDETGHWIVLGRIPFQRMLAAGLFPPEYAKLQPPNIDSFAGSDMVGIEYEPLFGFVNLAKESGKKAYYVAAADFVTTDEGTGVVHTAVMYGEDDFALGTKLNLPKVHTVSEDGTFNSIVQPWSGKRVKDPATEQEIVDHLTVAGKLYKEELYEHDYPFCWRCQSPLLYYAKSSWFILMSQLRSELLANNEKIDWVPGHIRDGRFGEWLREVKDWAISRERYWGTPLPIWVCANDTAHKTCVGSYSELLEVMERSGDKGPEKIDFDVHRPYIDHVILKCPTCGHDMFRIHEVADTWFDSGSMPFAQWHYPFDNRDRVDDGVAYPADYISEAIDQTRGWFYTLLAVATVLQKTGAVKSGRSFKTCVVLGHIRDRDGKKLSKSLGNYIDPMHFIDQHGSDALRFYLLSVNQPSEPKNFDEQRVVDVVKKNFMILWNVLSFWKLVVGSQPSKKNEQDSKLGSPTSDHVMDQWIAARTELLRHRVEGDLDTYAIVEAAREISEYIADLSTWYVRRSRDRAKGEGRSAVAATLGFVLRQFAKVSAPFTPFFSDALWRELGGQESVHLQDWPASGAEPTDLISSMSVVRKIVEAGHALRAEGKIKVRQPLSQVVIHGLSFRQDLRPILAEELNVKEVILASRPPSGADWRTVGNVSLDITITDELREEGHRREMVRAINTLRRDLGLQPGEKVSLTYSATDEVAKIVEHFATELKERGNLSTLKKRSQSSTPRAVAVVDRGQVVFSR